MADVVHARDLIGAGYSVDPDNQTGAKTTMAFFSDMFNRAGRVARGQANQGMSVIEDATFEATVNQTVADMKTELNNVVRASAMAMSNYNQLDAEYQKYVKQSQEWKDARRSGARRGQ